MLIWGWKHVAHTNASGNADASGLFGSDSDSDDDEPKQSKLKKQKSQGLKKTTVQKQHTAHKRKATDIGASSSRTEDGAYIFFHLEWK